MYADYLRTSDRPNKIPEVEAQYLKCIALEPANGKVRTEYAELWMYGYFTGVKDAGFDPDPVLVEKFQGLYQDAFEIDAQNPWLFANYALFCYWIKRERFGEPTETMASAEKSILMDPGDARLHANYAAVMDMAWWENQDCFPLIEAEYQKALELDPADVSIYIYLANFCIHSKKDLAAADALLRQAVDMEPTNPNIHVYYADFLWKHVKDLAAAETAYLRALDLLPDGEGDPRRAEVLAQLEDLRTGHEPSD
jgi:tetratricopeptide (TPR) repeat protein